MAGPREWQWRERIRARRHTARVYKTSVLVVGLLVILLGLVTIPLPGPGWLTVIVGFMILASEYSWAQRPLDFVRSRVHAWNEWVMSRSVVVRSALGMAGLVFLMAIGWLTFWLIGVPPWLPAVVKQPLADYAGLPGPALWRR